MIGSSIQATDSNYKFPKERASWYYYILCVSFELLFFPILSVALLVSQSNVNCASQSKVMFSSSVQLMTVPSTTVIWAILSASSSIPQWLAKFVMHVKTATNKPLKSNSLSLIDWANTYVHIQASYWATDITRFHGAFTGNNKNFSIARNEKLYKERQSSIFLKLFSSFLSLSTYFSK